MTASTPAIRTPYSKGRRYSSLRARSSISDEEVLRSCSTSLPTKCLIVAATPLF